MSLGTQEQYEQAIAAEHQELPREYMGRNGQLNIVKACEDILLLADLVEHPAGENETAEKIEQRETALNPGEWKDDRRHILDRVGSLFGQMLRHTGLARWSTPQSGSQQPIPHYRPGPDIGPGLW
jgi:hypothetical protein